MTIERALVIFILVILVVFLATRLLQVATESARHREAKRRDVLRRLEAELDLAAAELLRSAARKNVAEHLQKARELLKELDDL